LGRLRDWPVDEYVDGRSHLSSGLLGIMRTEAWVGGGRAERVGGVFVKKCSTFAYAAPVCVRLVAVSL